MKIYNIVYEIWEKFYIFRVLRSVQFVFNQVQYSNILAAKFLRVYFFQIFPVTLKNQ